MGAQSLNSVDITYLPVYLGPLARAARGGLLLVTDAVKNTNAPHLNEYMSMSWCSADRLPYPNPKSRCRHDRWFVPSSRTVQLLSGRNTTKTKDLDGRPPLSCPPFVQQPRLQGQPRTSVPYAAPDYRYTTATQLLPLTPHRTRQAPNRAHTSQAPQGSPY
jgi:hypothetical protein